MMNRLLIAVAVVSGGACAQWLNYPTPGTPRTPDGKPNLSAPAPRAADGKPDLSGIWQAEATSLAELNLPPGGVVTLGEGAPNKYFVNLLADFKPEEAPIRPAALAVFRQHAASAGKDFPTSLCLPAGVPAANLLPIPFRIVQAPGMTVFLYEGDTTFRQVYTDLRRHPVDPQPAWLGYAVGKWEGDTFVVDTLGFNDKSWLDAFGHPHSDALRVTERFRRLDFGRMELQITVDDSKSYTRPFTVKTNLILHADSDLLESFCAENEKDIVHLQAK